VQLAAIAAAEGIAPKYLEHIMIQLRKAGLVNSNRGPKGGYTPSRHPAAITFGEVFELRATWKHHRLLRQVGDKPTATARREPDA
jgi:Rrf2 family protein